MGLAMAQQGFLRGCPPTDPRVPPLPEGWIEELDGATHIPFYTHEESGRRTWVRPNFRPPPGGGGSGGGGGFQSRGHPPFSNAGPPPNYSRPPPNFQQNS